MGNNSDTGRMLHIEISLYFVVSFGFVIVSAETDEKPGGSFVYNDTRPSQMGFKPTWDPNGYVFFCLCMGAFNSHAVISSMRAGYVGRG